MKSHELKRIWVRRAREAASLTVDERSQVDEFLKKSEGMHTVNVTMAEFPKAIWRSILREAQLPSGLRTAVSLYVYGLSQADCQLDNVYQTSVADPFEFGAALQMSGCRTPNAEIMLNDRWYPVILSIRFHEDSEKIARAVELKCSLQIADRVFNVSHNVLRSLFANDNENAVPATVGSIIQEFGYRELQTTPAEFNTRLVAAERLASQNGVVVNVSGSVIVSSRFSWWRGYEVQALGSPEMPVRAVVESVLESGDREAYSYFPNTHDQELHSRLPFVRLFVLETKTYLYADIGDIAEYEFDTRAMGRLHLPTAMHRILQQVFETPIEKMFGDLLRGKHGGAVVLASGAPGVGKTLTAEIYAEISERPLYVLELGELGTKAAEVEENLQRVFARVTRWKAVLQFDECEIFLAKRGSDLERSAIVGIFLRLLDYYRGLLFLTTNRPEVLDDAVLSRVMLRLAYPDLNTETRARIWQTMFDVAGLKLANCTFEELGRLDLNGRQIRNLTRLARILFPDVALCQDDMNTVLHFGCGLHL